MLGSSNDTRRDFLKKLGLFGVGGLLGTAGLSACGGPEVSRLQLWGTGTLDIGKRWQRFEDKFSVNLDFVDNGNSVGPVIAQLRQGEFRSRHISGLQGGAESVLEEEGLIKAWDLDLIPNASHFWPWIKDIDYTKVEGETYGLPLVVNADSMIYLPDKLGEVQSYEAVFDPDNAGYTAMEDYWANSVLFAAIYLKENELISIEDPTNLTLSELDDVFQFLNAKAKEGQFRKLWSGWKDGVGLITNGEVWVMTGWEPIVYEAQSQGINAKYAVPREGFEGWSNDALLHPGASAAGVEEIAHKFVNWALSGYYGCSVADQRGYVVPNDLTSRYAELNPKEFDPEEIGAVVERVKQRFFQMKGNVYWQNVRPDNFRTYQEKWSKFRSLVQ